MPQLDYNPAGGKTQSLGDPNSGETTIYKKKAGSRKPIAQKKYSGLSARQEAENAANAVNGGGGGGGGSTASAATTGKTAAEKAAERRAAAKKRAEERAAAEAAKRNPLTAPFKTPNELRAEAARLAALGAVSEESLRTESAAQQADISGLTTGLSGRLAGLSNEYQAGLRGLAGAYTGFAGEAQRTGESLAAAAGAPSGLAPGASSTVQNTLLALGAVPATYAPAAEMRGAMLGGEARAALTKALTDRASKISADTAKYLYQLRDDELQRAIAQETSAQNLARLGLSQESQAWDQQMDVANLGLGQQRVAQSWQRLAQQAANAGSKAGKDRAKAIQSTKDRILLDIDKWTGASVPTGKYEYTVYFTDPAKGVQKVPKTIIASSASEAQAQAGSLVPAPFVASVEVEQGSEQLGVPSAAQIVSRIVPILVNKGMSRAKATAWVRKNIINPSFSNSSGGFMGGVGGSVR